MRSRRRASRKRSSRNGSKSGRKGTHYYRKKRSRISKRTTRGCRNYRGPPQTLEYYLQFFEKIASTFPEDIASTLRQEIHKFRLNQGNLLPFILAIEQALSDSFKCKNRSLKDALQREHEMLQEKFGREQDVLNHNLAQERFALENKYNQMRNQLDNSFAEEERALQCSYNEHKESLKNYISSIRRTVGPQLHNMRLVMGVSDNWPKKMIDYTAGLHSNSESGWFEDE